MILMMSRRSGWFWWCYGGVDDFDDVMEESMIGPRQHPNVGCTAGPTDSLHLTEPCICLYSGHQQVVSDQFTLQARWTRSNRNIPCCMCFELCQQQPQSQWGNHVHDRLIASYWAVFILRNFHRLQHSHVTWGFWRKLQDKNFAAPEYCRVCLLYLMCREISKMTIVCTMFFFVNQRSRWE